MAQIYARYQPAVYPAFFSSHDHPCYKVAEQIKAIAGFYCQRAKTLHKPFRLLSDGGHLHIISSAHHPIIPSAHQKALSPSIKKLPHCHIFLKPSHNLKIH
jgi:hypothetical protein